jgi:transcriptional accessory protein Tex/SPT6
VARAVRERAQADGVSLNKAVIRLLEEALGLSRTKRPKINHDFDEFIGVWTEKEANEFERHLFEERRIEPEMWK